jgi:hypothetical protein
VDVGGRSGISVMPLSCLRNEAAYPMPVPLLQIMAGENLDVPPQKRIHIDGTHRQHGLHSGCEKPLPQRNKFLQKFHEIGFDEDKIQIHVTGGLTCLEVVEAILQEIHQHI